MPRTRLLFAAAFCTLLTACSFTKPSFINEYKIDIQQGNVLTQDVVGQLKPGQTGKIETRKFSAFFNADNRLERVGGDVEVGGVAELTAPVTNSRLVDLGSLSGEAADTPLPPRQEPSMFSKIIDSLGF